jgi:hypothetical protein
MKAERRNSGTKGDVSATTNSDATIEDAAFLFGPRQGCIPRTSSSGVAKSGVCVGGKEEKAS